MLISILSFWGCSDYTISTKVVYEAMDTGTSNEFEAISTGEPTAEDMEPQIEEEPVEEDSTDPPVEDVEDPRTTGSGCHHHDARMCCTSGAELTAKIRPFLEPRTLKFQRMDFFW